MKSARASPHRPAPQALKENGGRPRRAQLPTLEICKVQGEIERYRQLVESGMTELQAKQQQTKELEAQIASLRVQNAERSPEVGPPRAEVDRACLKLAGLESKAAALRGEIDKMRREKYLLLGFNGGLEQELLATQKQLEELQQRREEGGQALKSAFTARQANLRASIDKAVVTEAGMTTFKQHLQSENRKKQEQLLQVIGNHSKLSQLSQTKLLEGEELLQAVRDKRAELRACRQQEEALQREIAANAALLEEVFQATNTRSVEQLMAFFARVQEENNELFKSTRVALQGLEEMRESKRMAGSALAASSGPNEDEAKKVAEFAQCSGQLEHVEVQIAENRQRSAELRDIVNALRLGLPAINDKLAYALGEEIEVALETPLEESLALLEQFTNRIVSVLKERGGEGAEGRPRDRAEEKARDFAQCEQEVLGRLRDSRLGVRREERREEEALVGGKRQEVEAQILGEIKSYFNRTTTNN